MTITSTGASAQHVNSDDVLAGNIMTKCQDELNEYHASSRFLNKVSHLVFWLVVWFALAVAIAVSGNSNSYTVATTVYLLALLAASAYLYASWLLIKRDHIAAPSENSAVSVLFDYYYALDKRNDRISSAVHISGAVMGVATAVLLIALVAFFVIGV